MDSIGFNHFYGVPKGRAFHFNPGYSQGFSISIPNAGPLILFPPQAK